MGLDWEIISYRSCWAGRTPPMACSGGIGHAAAGDRPRDQVAEHRAGPMCPIGPVHAVADFLGLVPDVAGQRLVGPFAGQRDLVSLLVHGLRQPQAGPRTRCRAPAPRPPDQLGKGGADLRAGPS